ncbi:porin [Paludibacterium yongneupense]|uniref:porin n=1 Tax=Paludibacterium yongneupense TaxID=400061 RepID=UPI0004022346|nr:porin [Paludibacterium yongneupense]
MNKTLIASALLALPMAAMADVTIYGTLNAGLQNDNTTKGSSQSRVDDYTSILGFKGNENLGNGLSSIWQVESRLHMDGTGSDTFASRESFVGLQSNTLGKIRLGNVNNSLEDLGTVDQWNYNDSGIKARHTATSTASVDNTLSSGANGLGVFTRTGQRLKNSVRYDSPTLYGFDGNIGYGFGENKTSSGDASNISELGLNYSNHNFFGHYAYQHESNPGQTSSGATSNNAAAHVHRLEVGYNDDKLFAAVGYQAATGYDWEDGFSGDSSSIVVNGNAVNAAARQLKTREAAVTVAYTYGSFRPKLSYAKGWDQKDNLSGTINNSGYRQYVAGVDYLLSKRTTVGVSYGNIKFGANSTAATADSSGNTSDTTIRTVGVSMTHSF